MERTRTEKMEARKPWRLSVFIKLVDRNIGYQLSLKKLHSMCKTQNQFALIDFSNDFFIVRLTNEKDYEITLFKGSWMIDDNYLHVQRWVPNFVTDEAQINKLLVLVRFHVLPLEYYTKNG